MSDSSNRQYFLGVAGEQQGPFSESDVRTRIRNGTISKETLVWFDGLAEWQAISSIQFFQDDWGGGKIEAAPSTSAFKPLEEEPASIAAPAPAPMIAPAPSSFPAPAPLSSAPVSSGFVGMSGAPATPTTSRGWDTPVNTTYSGSYGSEPATPVFGDVGGGGGVKDDESRKKWIIFSLLLIVFVLSGGAYFFFFAGESSMMDPGAAALKPKSERASKFPKAYEPTDRPGMARKAMSELLLNPEVSLKTLTKIATDNDTDEAGKEAVTAIVDYYRTNQRYQEAGQFLMEVKRYEEAGKYFVLAPNLQQDADKAFAAAIEKTTGETQKKLLFQDIELLLGPLNNQKLAIERIRLLSKNFPESVGRLSFYLKSNEQKANELFERLKPYFEKTLNNFITSEFAQINFEKPPHISIQKEGSNYRVIAKYDGDILLNRDSMKNINFVFWLVGEQWILVNTNLTQERQIFSRKEHDANRGAVLSGEAFLSFLETLFKTQYPKKSFHEDPANLRNTASEY